MLRKIKLFVILAVAVITLLFVFQNTQDFEVRFLLFRFNFPGAILLFSVFVAGFVVGGLVGANLAARSSSKTT